MKVTTWRRPALAVATALFFCTNVPHAEATTLIVDATDAGSVVDTVNIGDEQGNDTGMLRIGDNSSGSAESAIWLRFLIPNVPGHEIISARLDVGAFADSYADDIVPGIDATPSLNDSWTSGMAGTITNNWSVVGSATKNLLAAGTNGSYATMTGGPAVGSADNVLSWFAGVNALPGEGLGQTLTVRLSRQGGPAFDGVNGAGLSMSTLNPPNVMIRLTLETQLAPEPTSAAMATIASLGIVAFRRRRRK